VLGDGGGSCPKSLLGVTSGAGAAGGATGATGFGRAIGLFGADATLAGAAFFAAAFFGAAFFAAFRGAAFFAFFAFVTTFALLAFFAFFLATFLATPRFAFAAGRFFPFAFFFAMVSHLLAVIGLLVRVALKKSAVISGGSRR
jgi:hypothetical protein